MSIEFRTTGKIFSVLDSDKKINQLGDFVYFTVSENDLQKSYSPVNRSHLREVAEAVNRQILTIDLEKISFSQQQNVYTNVIYIYHKIEKRNTHIEASNWIYFWHLVLLIITGGLYSYKDTLKVTNFSDEVMQSLQQFYLNATIEIEKQQELLEKQQFASKKDDFIKTSEGLAQVLDKQNMQPLILYIQQGYSGSYIEFTASYFDKENRQYTVGKIWMDVCSNQDFYEIKRIESNGNTRNGLRGVGMALMQVAIEYLLKKNPKATLELTTTPEARSFFIDKIGMVHRGSYQNRLYLYEGQIQKWNDYIQNKEILYR